jgi:hypothetical protein
MSNCMKHQLRAPEGTASVLSSSELLKNSASQAAYFCPRLRMFCDFQRNASRLYSFQFGKGEVVCVLN